MPPSKESSVKPLGNNVRRYAPYQSCSTISELSLQGGSLATPTNLRLQEQDNSAALLCSLGSVNPTRFAIQAAFARARPGDIVLLLGKGHEACIIYGTEKVPWDEAGAARAALHALGYQKG